MKLIIIHHAVLICILATIYTLFAIPITVAVTTFCWRWWKAFYITAGGALTKTRCIISKPRSSIGSITELDQISRQVRDAALCEAIAVCDAYSKQHTSDSIDALVANLLESRIKALKSQPSKDGKHVVVERNYIGKGKRK